MSRGYFREFNCQDIYWFETSKNDHCRCGNWGYKCPSPQVNVPFPKNQKWPFILRMALLFSIVALLFSRSALLFPRSVFLFNVCVFQMLFPRWLYFLLFLLRAAQRNVICLALKTSAWCMISYVFYSSLILLDSLENAIFEHLEWLKLISWKHLVPLLNVSDHALLSKVAHDVSKCIFTIIDFLGT